jgi:tetratricopeptide (TPR) repeat protein
MFAGRSQGSLRWATLALELPHSDSVAVMALHIRGNGRLELGDMGGMDDLWQALHRAEASGTVLDQAYSYSYLSEWVGVTQGPAIGLKLNDASIEICDGRGILGQGMWARAESLWLLYDAGRWDELLDVVATLMGWATEHGDTIVESISLSNRARVLTHRGKGASAEELLERAIPVARTVGDLQVQAPVFVAAAVVEHARGDDEHALEHVREFEQATRDGPTEYRELQSPEVLRVCLEAGEIELAEKVLGDRPVFVTRTQVAVLTGKALLAEARGGTGEAAALFREAAATWESYGDPFERAHAIAGLARCLTALERPDEAEEARGQAARLFTALDVPIPAYLPFSRPPP